MKNFSSPLRDLIVSDTTDSIKNSLGRVKGKYIPNSCLILINSKFQDYLKKFDSFNLKKPQEILFNNQNEIGQSMIHEFMHCFHAMTSPLGIMDIICSGKQNYWLMEFLQTIDEYNDLPFEKYKNDRVLDRIYSKEFNSWLSYQKFLNCFKGVIRNKYVPRVKDYANSIHYVMCAYSDIYEKVSGRKANFKNMSYKLSEELVIMGEQLLVTSLFYFGSESRNSWRKQFSYNENYDCVFLTTHAILEGYAKLIEFYIDNLEQIDYCDAVDTENEIWKKLADYLSGIYSVTVTNVINDLHWILEERGIKEFIFTCFSAYEIALMTRFHPILLYESDAISLSEILIPRRYMKVVNFFSESKVSISDFIPESENVNQQIIQALDKICDEISFLRYSVCLEKTSAFYDSDVLGNDYYSILGKFYCDYKQKVDIFGVEIRRHPIHPIVFFNDVVIVPTALKDKVSQNNFLFFSIMDYVLSIYGYNIVSGEGLELTKKIIKFFSNIQNLNYDWNHIIQDTKLDFFAEMKNILN